MSMSPKWWSTGSLKQGMMGWSMLSTGSLLLLATICGASFFGRMSLGKASGFGGHGNPLAALIKSMFEAPLSNIVDGRNPAQSWM